MSTPRTDAFATPTRGLGTGYYQALEFARALEHQLDEARSLIQSTVGGLGYLAKVAPIKPEYVQSWTELENRMRNFLERTRD